VAGLLGQLGGQAVTILTLVRLLLLHFQTFAYYRDALKSHYYERRRELENQLEFESDWKPEL